MGVKRPPDISAAFAKFLNDRDKRGLLGLYSNDAILTIDGKTVARGMAEIAKMVEPFFQGPLKLVADCGACYETGDIALVRTDWKLVAPDGTVAMSGASAEVLRRGADAEWRFVVDDATYASRSA